MNLLLRLIIVMLIAVGPAAAQQTTRVFRITSSHTSFPDTARFAGHVYNKILYKAADHYSNNSILIFVPPAFHPGKKIDMVFWFHGWGNNIDSAAIRYDLVNQFSASGVNAVLLLAETTKDAPDSYGGKLERPDEFKALVNDVLNELKKEKVIHQKSALRNVVLAGHSGAYRVMAYILQNGNVPVKEVILFDALYSETDKFTKWIRANDSHRFVNIYTDSGGTDVETKEMAKQLMNDNLAPYVTEEANLTPATLRRHRIVIIHTPHKHNDIIQQPDNFRLFIENSVLKK